MDQAQSSLPSPAADGPRITFSTICSVSLSNYCCYDFALTNDGCLLLAAGNNGLRELNSNGKLMSFWCSPRQPAPPDMRDNWYGSDEVRAVAALSDGRAAVGLYWWRVVALVKRNAERVKADDWWLETHRFHQLRFWPQRMSVQNNVLAAVGCLSWGSLMLAADCDQLQLMNVSSQMMYCSERSRGYRVAGLAVTAAAVVTASSCDVHLPGSGRIAQVIDAHRLWDDVLLWRRSDLCSSSEERLHDVCADSSAGVLYVAVRRTDSRSGRVAAVSLHDGSELQHVALSFEACPQEQQVPLLPFASQLERNILSHSVLLPSQLALSDCVVQEGTRCYRVLAVVCWNPRPKCCTTAILHRSKTE